MSWLLSFLCLLRTILLFRKLTVCKVVKYSHKQRLLQRTACSTFLPAKTLYIICFMETFKPPHSAAAVNVICLYTHTGKRRAILYGVQSLAFASGNLIHKTSDLCAYDGHTFCWNAHKFAYRGLWWPLTGSCTKQASTFGSSIYFWADQWNAKVLKLSINQ
jgi:hypothetical protein